MEELIKLLISYAEAYRRPPYGHEINGTPELLEEAADTIEVLAAKLQAANMERSSAYYNGGWIPVTERLPEEGKRYLVSALWKNEYFEIQRTYDAVYGGDGVWHTHNYEPMPCKIIAWMPLPEPYKEPYPACMSKFMDRFMKVN